MDGPRKFFTSSIVDFSSSIRQNREAFNLSIFDFGPFVHVQWFDFSVNGEFAFDTSPEKSEFKIEFGVMMQVAWVELIEGIIFGGGRCNGAWSCSKEILRSLVQLIQIQF